MNLRLLAVAAAVVAAGLIAAQLGFRRRNLPAGIELMLGTGTPFIFLGVCLGPQGLGVINDDIWHQVGPIVLMGFGWIGFLYGTHFELRQLRRFKARVYLAGFWESLLTMGVVSVVAWFVRPYVEPGQQSTFRIAASAGLGICAAGTAPGGISTLAARGTVKRQNLELAQWPSIRSWVRSYSGWDSKARARSVRPRAESVTHL